MSKPFVPLGEAPQTAQPPGRISRPADPVWGETCDAEPPWPSHCGKQMARVFRPAGHVWECVTCDVQIPVGEVSK